MTADPIQAASLAAEVDYFHQSLFRKSTPKAVIERYVEAHHPRFHRVFDPSDLIAVSAVVRQRLDVEAVEFELRCKKKGHALSKKLQILSFLLEVRAEYYDFFVNTSESRITACLKLAAALLMTPFKRLKGKYLVWRYDLA